MVVLGGERSVRTVGGAGEKEKQRVRKKVKGKSVGGTKIGRTGEREREGKDQLGKGNEEETKEKEKKYWMK